MVSVKDFGAVGDGITGDTAAINCAIDSVSAAGGGDLFFPYGTYILDDTVVIKDMVTLIGEGFERTVLKGADGTPHDLIKSYCFDTLTGTNSTGGPRGFGFRDMSIDGNRYNRTGSGSCVKLYAKDYEMSRVEIYDSCGVGLYSEWSTAGNVPITPYGKDTMEAHITNLRTFRCATDGIVFNGPHDSILRDILTYINGRYGAVFADSNVFSAGGTMVDQLHSYGNASWGVKISTMIFAGHIESEWNTAGGGIQVSGYNGSVNGGILNAWSNIGPGVEFNSSGSFASVVSHHNTGNGVNMFSTSNQIGLNAYSNGGDGLAYGASCGNNTVSPCRTVGNSGKGIYLQGNDNRIVGLCGMGNAQGGVVVNGGIGGLRMDGELSVNTGTQIAFGTLGAPCIIDLVIYTNPGQTAWSGTPGNNFVRIAARGADIHPLNSVQT